MNSLTTSFMNDHEIRRMQRKIGRERERERNAVKVAASTIATKRSEIHLNWMSFFLCVLLFGKWVCCVSPVSKSCIQILLDCVVSLPLIARACARAHFYVVHPHDTWMLEFCCFCHILCKTIAAGHRRELWWRQWTAVTLMWMMKGGRDLMSIFLAVWWNPIKIWTKFSRF